MVRARDLCTESGGFFMLESRAVAGQPVTILTVLPFQRHNRGSLWRRGKCGQVSFRRMSASDYGRNFEENELCALSSGHACVS